MFPKPKPELVALIPLPLPQPEPPLSPVLSDILGLSILPPPPPPVEVIVVKPVPDIEESEPLAPFVEVDTPPAPPSPTVIV